MFIIIIIMWEGFMTAWFNDNIAFLGTVSIDCIGGPCTVLQYIQTLVGHANTQKYHTSQFKNHISFNILERSTIVKIFYYIIELCDCVNE